jgi:hypothetical protein
MTGINNIHTAAGNTVADESFEDLSPTGNNQNSDFDIIDNEEYSNLIKETPPKDTKLPDDMLRNVKFHKCSGLSEAQIAAIDNMRAPKTRGFFSNLFSAIGRSFVKGINAVKSLFSSTKLNDTIRNRTAEIRNMTPFDMSELPDDSKKISFDMDQMGKLTGLGSKIEVIPFKAYSNESSTPDQSYRQYLFPHGEPRLDDIKQNPSLQDCWFLASISSILNSQGTTGIERLFSPSTTKDHVLVRLGENLYDVPLGRYSNGSEKFGSNSANWVVALENAMQMHLLATANSDKLSNLTNNSDPVNIRMKTISEGFRALAANKNVDVNVMLHPTNSKTDIDQIKTAIKNKRPVALGHIGNAFKALANGVSPHHAISVLGLTPKEDALIVLDPYGEIKKFDFSSLKDCRVFIAEEPPQKTNN